MGKYFIALTGKTKLADGKPVGSKAGRFTRPTMEMPSDVALIN